MTLYLTEKEFGYWREIVTKINDPELLKVHNQLFGNGERPVGVTTQIISQPEGRQIKLDLGEPVAIELLRIIHDYSDLVSDASRNLPSIGKFLFRIKNFGRDLAAVFKKK